MIVVDASVVVDAFVGNAFVSDVAAATLVTDAELHAPHLIDLEVASALRRLAAAGMVTDADAAGVLGAMKTVDLHRHDHTPLLGQIWAMRGNVNSYDGAYVALATTLGVPLLTADRKLAATPGLTCQVELV